MADFVHYGIVQFELNEPTLLFLGNSESLRIFATFLREASVGLKVFNPDWSKAANVRLLCIEVANSPSSVKIEGESIKWLINPRDLAAYADNVDGVARNATSAHTYLDAQSPGNLPIIVSKGEYPDAVFESLMQ